MLFGDAAGDAPWWVAGAMGAVGVGYAVAKFYFHVQSTRRAEAGEQDAQDEGRENRRAQTAANHCWQVVERQNKVIEAFDAKYEALERRLDEADARGAKCEADHAATLAMLKFVVAWARNQKNPLPLPDDWLDRLGAGGSGPHAPLPAEGK
jgi:hypothetical protein